MSVTNDEDYERMLMAPKSVRAAEDMPQVHPEVTQKLSAKSGDTSSSPERIGEFVKEKSSQASSSNPVLAAVSKAMRGETLTVEEQQIVAAALKDTMGAVDAPSDASLPAATAGEESPSAFAPGAAAPVEVTPTPPAPAAAAAPGLEVPREVGVSPVPGLVESQADLIVGPAVRPHREGERSGNQKRKSAPKKQSSARRRSPQNRAGVSKKWIIAGAAGVVSLTVLSWTVAMGDSSDTPTAGSGGDVAAAGVADMSSVPFQGAALPVSLTAGPVVFTDVEVSGFEPSELGAALAALHLTVRVDPSTSPAVFTPVLTSQATGGNAELLALRNEQYAALAAAAGVTGGSPVISPTGEMQAWRIDEFSTDGPVSVHLLVKTPQNQQLVEFSPVVQWNADLGDYEIVVLPDGADPSQVVASAEGFTPFF